MLNMIEKILRDLYTEKKMSFKESSFVMTGVTIVEMKDDFHSVSTN